MISKKMVKFRSWKTWRSHGKGHEISKAEKTTNLALHLDPLVGTKSRLQKKPQSNSPFWDTGRVGEGRKESEGFPQS